MPVPVVAVVEARPDVIPEWGLRWTRDCWELEGGGLPFEMGEGAAVGSGGAVPGFMAEGGSACWGFSVLLLLVRGWMEDEVMGTVIS